jgi:hypothetical protein
MLMCMCMYVCFLRAASAIPTPPHLSGICMCMYVCHAAILLEIALISRTRGSSVKISPTYMYVDVYVCMYVSYVLQALF